VQDWAQQPACSRLQVRLHNWNALTPHLLTFGLLLTPDEKALIVAGGALASDARRSQRC